MALSETMSIWATHDKDLKNGRLVDISSGGLQANVRDAEPPCLCLDSATAIKLWEKACRDFGLSLPVTASYRWVEAPVLEKWLITVTNPTGTHRAASTRYAVYSRVMVSDEVMK